MIRERCFILLEDRERSSGTRQLEQKDPKKERHETKIISLPHSLELLLLLLLHETALFGSMRQDEARAVGLEKCFRLEVLLRGGGFIVRMQKRKPKPTASKVLFLAFLRDPSASLFRCGAPRLGL